MGQVIFQIEGEAIASVQRGNPTHAALDRWDAVKDGDPTQPGAVKAMLAAAADLAEHVRRDIYGEQE